MVSDAIAIDIIEGVDRLTPRRAGKRTIAIRIWHGRHRRAPQRPFGLNVEPEILRTRRRTKLEQGTVGQIGAISEVDHQALVRAINLGLQFRRIVLEDQLGQAGGDKLWPHRGPAIVRVDIDGLVTRQIGGPDMAVIPLGHRPADLERGHGTARLGIKGGIRFVRPVNGHQI